MKALIINAHQPYPFSPGKLNSTLVNIASQILQSKGYAISHTDMQQDIDMADELNKYKQTDVIILQSPVNWMGVPWLFKKYMDDVYSAGMGGDLCDGDGRHHDDSESQYGAGGTLNGKKYMLSLTLNAPKAAFNNENQYLFQGKSVDDLFLPQHMNFRFFGMQSLPTFACYDVLKNPQIERDFERYRNHLEKHF